MGDVKGWLHGLDPYLQPGRFVFVSVSEVPAGVHPIASVIESEGRSLVLEADHADKLGLPYEFVAGMITLQAQTDLEIVGLTAAVTSALAKADIACNVIAGYHHDHPFVPYERRQEAVAILQRLAQLD